MSTKPPFSVGVVIAISAQLIVMLSSVAIVVIASRILDKHALGTYFFGMVIVQFSVTIGDLGLRNAIIRYIAIADRENDEEMFKYIITVACVRAAAMFGVLLVAGSVAIRIWDSLAENGLVLMVSLTATLTLLQSVATSISAGRQQFDVLGKLSAKCEILRLVVSISGLLVGLGINGLFAGIICGRVGVLAGFYSRNRKNVAWMWRHQKGSEMFRFGRWLYGGSLASVLSVRCTDLALMSYGGPAALALYSTAQQIPMAVARIFESVRPALIGKASSTDNKSTTEVAGDYRILSGVVCLSVGILIPYSQHVVDIVFPSDYREGGPILSMLLLWIILHLYIHMHVITLTGDGKGKSVLVIQTMQVILLLMSLPLTIRKWDVLGAAVSMVLSALAASIIGLWIVGRNDRVLFKTLFRVVSVVVCPVMGIIVLNMTVSVSILCKLCESVFLLAWWFLFKVTQITDAKELWYLLRNRKIS